MAAPCLASALSVLLSEDSTMRDRSEGGANLLFVYMERYQEAAVGAIMIKR